jgi:hypothetical protein
VADGLLAATSAAGGTDGDRAGAGA